jgi:hypothetical protein
MGTSLDNSVSAENEGKFLSPPSYSIYINNAKI